MKKVNTKLWATVVGIAIAAFLLGFWLSGDKRDDHAHQGHQHGGSTVQAAAEVWTCSMHPQVRQPQSGKCPICAMDLIPMANDDSNGDDADLPRLTLSPRSVALLQVQTVPVRRKQVHAEVRMPGRLAVDETKYTEISARFGGRVERLEADFTGKPVREGEALFQIYSPEMHSVHQELLQALRRTGEDSRETAIAREKVLLLGQTEVQLRELEKAEEAATHFTVLSQSDGVILERFVYAGQYVEPGDVLYRVNDLKRIWGLFEVFESQQSGLSAGLAVEVSIQGVVDARGDAIIEFVDPVVDVERRSLRVRVALDNRNHELRPGMLASAVVKVPAAEEGGEPLVIPTTAPLITGRRAVVYVQLTDKERPTFEARDIKLGGRYGEFYHVKDGLREGELVVTHGQFKIDSELQIRGRPSMMAPGDKQHVEQSDSEKSVVISYRDHLDDAFRQDVRLLAEAYLRLTEALAADSESRTADAIDAVRERLRSVGEHRLRGDAHVAWMKIYQSMDTVLRQIGEDVNVGKVRTHLQRLNNQVEMLYRQFGGEHLPKAYLAYCPMVDGDKGGSWLQSGERVNNPYFGSMMLRCGDVLEQLN
ncbi:MAG: efflux RND transporter periplasmic adaptor subunit [Verrucomicrobia bacterium]|nr:efflux RND transporter periplasmic adaptor subunit [Verrucomicrobiota bacterium]